jgi:hypothetical protein
MLKLDLNPPPSQLRQFAWISLFAFPAIGWLVLHLWHGTSTTPAWILTAVGAGVFASQFVLPAAVRVVFVGLMLVAVPLGIVLSTIVLALIYYGMFTPVALLFRVMGRDKLKRRLDPQARSYWVERKTDIPAARYLRMY